MSITITGAPCTPLEEAEKCQACYCRYCEAKSQMKKSICPS